MTNTINNVTRELKPVLAMILNALDRDAADGKQARAEMAAELRALLSATSPAGVDGLEVVATAILGGVEYGWGGPELGEIDVELSMGALCRIQEQMVSNEDSVYLDLCSLSDATAIIDGLRGGVAELRKRAKTAEREAGSALRTYKGLEKVARVVSDNSDQVCGELNVLRQQFDQHAHRIGELEGLLRKWRRIFDGVPGSGQLGVLRGQTDAALSASKEGE